MVSWLDAMAFCQKASEKTGRVVRLPTEAEWEYACRAGGASRFHAGDRESELAKCGWYYGNAGGSTHPVGRLAPNAWGLHDMHGNVWEWCSDYFHPEYYAQSPEKDPTGPAKGRNRVERGGSWVDLPPACRSSYRASNSPDPGFAHRALGFRVVVETPQRPE
jgi:formylglycine-generating enzyme required for sulfatase activity